MRRHHTDFKWGSHGPLQHHEGSRISGATSVSRSGMACGEDCRASKGTAPSGGCGAAALRRGAGRQRRGERLRPTTPASVPPRAPRRPIPDDDNGPDLFSAASSAARGRGRGEPAIPPSPIIPPFSSFSSARPGILAPGFISFRIAHERWIDRFHPLPHRRTAVEGRIASCRRFFRRAEAVDLKRSIKRMGFRPNKPQRVEMTPKKASAGHLAQNGLENQIGRPKMSKNCIQRSKIFRS
jgi:hypothetical protein